MFGAVAYMVVVICGLYMFLAGCKLRRTGCVRQIDNPTADLDAVKDKGDYSVWLSKWYALLGAALALLGALLLINEVVWRADLLRDAVYAILFAAVAAGCARLIYKTRKFYR